LYFDLSNAIDIFTHNLLLLNFIIFGFSSGYVNWFHSYLINIQSFVRLSGNLSRSYVARSGVPRGSTLGPLHFNIFINNGPIRDSILNSKCLFFADDLKIYHSIYIVYRIVYRINGAHDCKTCSLTVWHWFCALY
jgi:hypothetical protein